MGRIAIVLATASLGVLVGTFSLHVARDEPAYSFAGASGAGAVALFGAGWALIGVGLASRLRRFGLIVAAAGVAWFLLEWNNPGVGSPLAFTIGLVFYAACPALVGHAVLAYPSGRLRSHLERAVVGVAYAGSMVVLGLLPALFFDPQAQEGCSACPRNVLLMADRAGAVDELNRVGVVLGLAWSVALAALAARRARSAVLAGGAVYMSLVASIFALSLDRGFVAAGPHERQVWLVQAAALVGIALGVAWSRVRTRRARTAVARLVVELAQSPPPGGLRDALASLVGDPGLVLAYPLGDGRLVDAGGRPVELPAGRERTRLVQDGRAVAVLAHTRGLLDDEQLVHEVTAASRLALENERLQAEVRARLEELRASRARIVEAGDAERKRLERDLHDGAQQRLMGVSLSLSLVRSQLSAATRLDEAAVELRSAITELRELAHGIFPAVLADEGLAAAVEALAEEAPVPLRIDGVPERRFPPPVETAAYTVVVEATRAATRAVNVRARCVGETLALEIESGGFRDALDVVALEDRVGALDGRVAVERLPNGGVTIRAELPCES